MTSLTRPLPPEALPIVRIIRYGVPRPVELPELKSYGLRWGRYCPLGLLSCAQHVSPGGSGIYGFAQATFAAFTDWWDEQCNPAAAVAAVWDEPLDAFEAAERIRA